MYLCTVHMYVCMCATDVRALLLIAWGATFYLRLNLIKRRCCHQLLLLLVLLS